MNKNEKAAIAAVIAYLDLENEASGLVKMKRKSYEKIFSHGNDSWQENGVRNIMTGRKILGAKKAAM
ncbi:MAG: hypothetical protein AB7E04_03170 [Desulfobacteraceae bacterium]